MVQRGWCIVLDSPSCDAYFLCKKSNTLFLENLIPQEPPTDFLFHYVNSTTSGNEEEMVEATVKIQSQSWFSVHIWLQDWSVDVWVDQSPFLIFHSTPYSTCSLSQTVHSRLTNFVPSHIHSTFGVQNFSHIYPFKTKTISKNIEVERLDQVPDTLDNLKTCKQYLTCFFFTEAGRSTSTSEKVIALKWKSDASEDRLSWEK